LKDDLSSFLFDPRETVRFARDRQREAFQAKRGGAPSTAPVKRKRRPKVQPKDHNDWCSYSLAVARACDCAFPHPTIRRPHWWAMFKEERAALKAMPKRERAKRLDYTPEQKAELKRWRRDHRWSLLQLLHTRGTQIRAQYGLKAAQNVLGHRKAEVTEIYAERDRAKAEAIMAETG
jgi:hypothetical protein